MKLSLYLLDWSRECFSSASSERARAKREEKEKKKNLKSAAAAATRVALHRFASLPMRKRL
jgi:hypothetical protein